MSARFQLLLRLAVLMGAVVMSTTALATPSPSLRQGATAVGSAAHRNPRDRVLGGTALYDNIGNPANTYYADQGGAEAIDDLHLVSGGSLDAVEFEYLDPDATEPFSATVRIYSNPGDDSDISPLAGPYVVNGLSAGRHLVSVTLPGAPAVAADLWVGVQFSSTTAGLIINDVPSIGTSHDIYVENGNVLYFGGDPKANFGLRLVDDLAYELTVTMVGQGTVTKNPDQASYAPGTNVTLTAAPDPGWHFVGWSGAASGSGSAEVTMDAAKSVTATFAINTYALGVTIVGQGSVSKTPDQAAYDHGSMVQLAATPDPGWSFVGWSGDASGSDNPLGVTMDAAKSVTATFAENNYVLSVTIVGQGMVTKDPDQASYTPGTIVTLTAVPESGWHFVGWSGDASGSGSAEVTMDAARSVTATFAINTYALGVTIVGQGSVSKTPDQASYDHGSIVQLTPTPDPGWSFVGWSGDASGSVNPLGVTMNAAKSVTATFAQDSYVLTVTIVGQGTVTKNPDQASYASGTIVTLTAAPDPGWHFVGWSGAASGSGSAEVTMDAAKSVTATFAINTYALGVTIVGQGSVSKTPDQASYDHGSIVQLTPTPDAGWSFAGWSGDASGSNNPLDVTMNASKSVTATFAAPATNLVTNGTFESNLNGWNGYHDATIARVAGGHESTYAVRVTGPTPADAKFGLNDSPSWVLDAGPAGTMFEISAYVRSSTSTSPIAMRIREYMNDERIGTREYSNVLSLSTDWQKSSMQYISRATGTKFDFQILNTGNVAGDVFLIDDVVIQKTVIGSSAAMTIERPTASSVLVTDAAAVVEWTPLGVPVDSSVVNVTMDGGDSWSRVGTAHGSSSVIWRLPHASASGAVLLVESYSNGVLVGDAVSDPLRIAAGAVGIDDGLEVPREISLDLPRPAPLVTHTTLGFGLPRRAHVHVRVLDLQGRGVATLAQGAFEAGRHDITWDGTSERRAVRPGIYFVCMDALGKSLVRKIAVTR